MGLSSGSLADLLAFEAWPEEMKKIARAAVAEECDEEPSDEQIEGAMDDQLAADNAQFKLAHEWIDHAVKHLTTARDRLAPHLVDCEELIQTVHDEIAFALTALAAIPDKIEDVKELPS